jgi:hypothetical protein
MMSPQFFIFRTNIYSNNTFILAFEAVFSLMSGYINVLVYEYSAEEQQSSSQRATAASTLNMSFQVRSTSFLVFDCRVIVAWSPSVLSF